MVERRAALGWDDRKYSDIVSRLESKGLIEKVRVKIGKGAPRILYQNPSQTPSIKHEYFVYWISEQLKKIGIVCKTNKVGPDMEAEGIAIEVELGKSDIYGNVRGDLEGFRAVIVCPDSKEVIKRVRGEMADNRAIYATIEEVPALLAKMCLNANESPI